MGRAAYLKYGLDSDAAFWAFPDKKSRDEWVAEDPDSRTPVFQKDQPVWNQLMTAKRKGEILFSKEVFYSGKVELEPEIAPVTFAAEEDTLDDEDIPF